MYPAYTSVIVFYGITIICLCIVTYLMWRYATFQNRLTDDIDENRANSMKMRPILNSIGFLISIPVAFDNALFSMIIWGIMIFTTNIIIKRLYKP
jgi:magnesium-transporting ATPase (P-type)